MRRDVLAGAAFWLLLAAFFSSLLVLGAGKARGETARGDAARAEAARPEAMSDETWRQFRGQVLFSDILFAPPTEFPSAATRVASLRRTERTVVEGPNGFWRIHCVAFLDPPAKTSALMLRATDVTDPKGRREVRVFEVTVEPGDKELAVDDLVLTEAIGFQHGHRYEVAVERGGEEPGTAAAAGKRDVYAKGVVTLM
jgi:hypothetical protein